MPNVKSSVLDQCRLLRLHGTCQLYTGERETVFPELACRILTKVNFDAIPKF